MLPLMRPKHGRVLCGVCLGVSKHLGLVVWKVRMAFLGSTLLFGAGLIAYAFLWIFVPVGDPQGAAAAMLRDAEDASAQPLSRGNRSYTGQPQSNAAADATSHHRGGGQDTHDEQGDAPDSSESLLMALRRAPKPSLIAFAGLAMVGISIVTLVSGIAFGTIAATLFALAGIGIAWLRYNASTGQLRSMIIGLAMQFFGYAIYILTSIAPGSDSPGIPMILLAGLAMLAGTGVSIVPWLHSLIRDVGTERALKEREEERADMAAHLHDGVLQTLALIQLHSKEPTAVFALARQQERELRDWLYQERTPPERSVSRGLNDIAAQVEDEHGKPIEVVSVGDARPSAQTDALLDATRQALVNAAVHGGEPISVYCEACNGTVEVFVRDHGAGFEVDSVPAHRLGIRESIIGRITRRGGTVEIVSKPNWGTEVRMHMPVACVGDKDGSGNNGNTGNDSDDGAIGAANGNGVVNAGNGDATASGLTVNHQLSGDVGNDKGRR
ncbi:ATP-binding protein [Bifidobacterium sp.]|jgi:signal transduction histidine kinase/phage shock protein PspC (stress-responsive transcriptional regulator)|uniref:ATP-binding protein n=1 Tax=Bifidobacterium sp. TaxID=41200 RepID=UPI0034191B1D